MPDELPPIDKFVVSGYSEAQPDYPIVIVVKDTRAPGYGRPTIGTACPDSRYSGHKFVGTAPTNIDNRAVWTYKILPGPTVTSLQHDPETDVFIETRRTEDFNSAIASDLVQDSSYVTITEKQIIDAVVGYRVVTKIPKGEFYDVDNAQVEYELLPYEFPGFLYSYGDTGGVTITAPDFFGFSVGVRQSKSLTALHTIKTWWVIDTTPPVLTYDEISPGTIEINGQTHVVLHDAILRSYNGFPVTIPATTPSFTEYYGTVDGPVAGEPPPDPFAEGTAPKWIGTSRVIRGSVKRAGSKFRHRVQTMSVVMKGV